MDDNKSPQGQVASNKAEKQAYSRPELKVFGNVRNLTQGGSYGRNPDAVSGMMGASDRNVKENIVLVGQHPLGIGLYLFDYKSDYRQDWGHGRQMGVMADEVETVMPEAVSVHPKGHKMVDYALLATRH